MKGRLKFFLIKAITIFLLIPVIILTEFRSILRPLKLRGVFSYIIENFQEVLIGVELRSRLVKLIVKSTLLPAVILYKNKSFKKTFIYVFRIFGRVPPSLAFLDFGGDSVASTNAAAMHREYVDFLITRSSINVSADFVSLTEKVLSGKSDIKPIAFYLPQFHAFPLNDEWYGKGFTEWTNVTKSIPHYLGHHQPQLPIDMSFYDLNDISVMYRQVELAKNYGIHAFCFHYYWFSGEKLMEMPLLKFLENQDLDFPFCINWANENWTKLWDGGNREVRYKQELLPGDDEKFFMDILPYLTDRRYIKVQEKPLFLIYRPHIFSKERCQEFVSVLREKAIEHGFPGLYIVAVNSHGFDEDPREWGLDAMMEFPPHGMSNHGLKEKKLEGFVNPYFQGKFWDAEEYIREKKYLYKTDYKLFKGVAPSWDNSARKAYSNAAVYHGITPKIYKEWLSGCIEYTRENHAEDERFVFINAWNEWAEGAHLEPDNRYGYAYLQATWEALHMEHI